MFRALGNLPAMPIMAIPELASGLFIAPPPSVAFARRTLLFAAGRGREFFEMKLFPSVLRLEISRASLRSDIGTISELAGRSGTPRRAAHGPASPAGSGRPGRK